LKVIQFGIGPIGSAIVKLLVRKKKFRIVGAIDIDKAKVGKDLGEVVGLPGSLGVKVSDNPAKVFREAKADLVVHSTSSFISSVKGQLEQITKAKLDIVSTCEELSYPFRKYPKESRALDRLAKKYKTTMLGTGVNPGFLMDTLVLASSGVCQDIDSIIARRIQDAGSRRLPFQKKIGVGLTPNEFNENVASGKFGHIGLPESAAMVAEKLGWRLKEIHQKIEPIIAQNEVASEYITVKPGQVRGLSQTADAIDPNGREIVKFEFQASLKPPEAFDQVLINGSPPVDLMIRGGVHGDLATAAVVVNMIPKVAAAKPGLVTMADLPIPSAVGAVR
jgi:4-hydroxy-tetrahydrodipicolinate reductase